LAERGHQLIGVAPGGYFPSSSGVPLVAAQSGLAFGGVSLRQTTWMNSDRQADSFGAVCTAVWRVGCAVPRAGKRLAWQRGTGLNYFADPGAATACSGQSFWPRTPPAGRGNPCEFWFWNQDLSVGKTTTLTERLGWSSQRTSSTCSTTSPSRIPESEEAPAFMDVTKSRQLWRISAQAYQERLAGTAGSIRFARGVLSESFTVHTTQVLRLRANGLVNTGTGVSAARRLLKGVSVVRNLARRN